MKIQRLLIANRGEIACRVMHTAKQLGIHTIAIYSQADARALHVKQADSAILLHGKSAADTYLDQAQVLAAARASGADAIHPGYGFLSENTDFAAACETAGILFVGPPASAITLMGDKAAARLFMQQAGVPVLPGFDDKADAAHLQQEADRIGYPLLIKAVAGGGGKGMREVHAAADFAASLAAAQREARHAFGDDQVLLERYLPTARHVEVQVFADSHGQCVYLFERDCSVQRRHQKVIEEAPAPGLSEALRQAMGQAAVTAAQAVNYVGAGTVEFLLAPDNHFYFMEMNTRLQVEHPVTEAITGQDLVAWQLAVAEGAPLPLMQEALTCNGHAMEVRLYAEDPWMNFLPAAGCIDHRAWPDGIRIDTGVTEGDEVTSLYDPMIAKLISHGRDRDEARTRLIAALDQLQLSGLAHNAGFLRQVLASTPFAQADLSTRLLQLHPALCEKPVIDPRLLALAACLAARPSGTSANPWDRLDGWRPLGAIHYQQSLTLAGESLTVTLTQDAASVDGDTRPLRWHRDERHQLHINWGDDSLSLRALLDKACQQVLLFHQGQDQVVSLVPPPRQADSHDQGFAAPMSGTVLLHQVAPGSRVQKGDAVITLEAMKMEHTLHANQAGRVIAYLAAPGDHVTAGTQLVEFEVETDD
jgi:3-methylcrotonyl-CoA carboxylase alpha subunit